MDIETVLTGEMRMIVLSANGPAGNFGVRLRYISID